MNKPTQHELPDPFRRENGSRVQTQAQWRRHRQDLLERIVDLQYGGLPPTPEATDWEELHTSRQKKLEDARYITCRILTGPDRPFSFLLQLLVPAGDGPFPVVLNGDGCWRTVTDEVAETVVRRGCILARFNRVEIAPDIRSSERTSGLYRVYPEGSFGALAAWAWGYHRCVDALVTMEAVDPSRIAVTGHSRGGKTVLLAGAVDERIALTCPNNSGAGGAGCYRRQGPNSETLADLVRVFPYWFGPRLRDFVGREADLPFDQHILKALVAPRLLLTTEALGDLWANPTGTWQTHAATREVYRALNAEENIGIRFREGGHGHRTADWETLLDFMDGAWHGRPFAQSFHLNPFPEQSPAFSWSAPAFGPNRT